MTVSQPISLTLDEFLKLPETKPAGAFIDGAIYKKPIPKSRHSRLQGKLIDGINDVVEAKKIAYAFPELRCTFGDRSIVPDIAVFYWQNIQLDEAGEPFDDVLAAPDWSIEILSPEQSSNRVTGNLLHCLNFGCKLGWLIDPGDRSVIVFRPQQQPDLFHQNDRLLVLEGLDLTLTIDQLFGWLNMNA